jgi:hypothetical protein
MINKNAQFSWGSKENEAFDKIKEDINQESTLSSPYFDRFHPLNIFLQYCFCGDLNIEELGRRKVSCGFYEFRPIRS